MQAHVDCAGKKMCWVSLRQPCLHGELSEHHGGSRVLLRGLQNEGVAGGASDGEHPQRDHGREVEGADASTHLHMHMNMSQLHEATLLQYARMTEEHREAESPSSVPGLDMVKVQHCTIAEMQINII